MAEISRFFNSIDHDRVYSAADWAAYFASFIGNGVMPQPSSQLMVAAGDDTGLSLSVAPGHAFISGYGYENTAALPLTLTTANGSYSRIDRVYDENGNVVITVYIAGEVVAEKVITDEDIFPKHE